MDKILVVTIKQFSAEAEERAIQVKKLHEQVREKIVKQNEKYRDKANIHRKYKKLKEGDLVWVHHHKERFSDEDHCNSRTSFLQQGEFDAGANDQPYEEGCAGMELMGKLDI